MKNKDLKLQFFADKIERLFKMIPRLPAHLRKSLAENIWWLAILAVIILAGIAFSIAFALVSAISMMGAAAGTYGYYPPASLSIHWIILESLLFVEVFVSTILVALSIKGLKEREDKSWNLLFVTFLVGVMMTVVNVLIYGASNIVWSLLGLFLGFYVIFEIRFYFRPKKKRRARQK